MIPSERRNILGDRDLYWFNNDAPQSHHQSSLIAHQENKVDSDCTFINTSDNMSYTQIEENISRDEVIARRKEKVAASRRMKKMEKRQLKQIVSGVQVAKPDFSLEQAAEDFPALCSAKQLKKTKPKKNKEINVNVIPHYRIQTKPMEKSWKPKIKDPIYVDLCQALLPKPEKPKYVVKKIDALSDRYKLVGNTLDSDNPTLNKGKVRPNKVKRLSKLKVQILADRDEQYRRLTGNHENGQQIVEETISPLYTGFTDQISNLLAKCAFVETDVTPPVEEPDDNLLPVNVVNHIHSRKFREYCTNCITKEVVESVCALLDKVAYFQDRTFAKDPIRAHAKRRYVAGLNQTNKYLHVKKLKLLIIAPDLEKSPGIDGLDVRVRHFIKEVDQQGVPCVFGPSRRRLGKAVLKRALVSCVGILSYEGAEEQFAKVLETLQDAKSKYQDLVANYNEKDSDEYDHPQTCDQEANESKTDVTSFLLATLKEELLSPGEKLLSAINHCSY